MDAKRKLRSMTSSERPMYVQLPFCVQGADVFGGFINLLTTDVSII